VPPAAASSSIDIKADFHHQKWWNFATN